MIKAQRGTKDIFGDESLTWQWILKNAQNVFQNACFSEIKTPIFEATELFARGVGDSTDIVNKEMYTFSVGGADKESDAAGNSGDSGGEISGCLLFLLLWTGADCGFVGQQLSGTARWTV